MHPRKNKIPWLSKLPVLFVYLLFFTVQLFFNYGATRPVYSIVSAAHLQSGTVNHSKVKSPKTIVRQKVRLNKRFEPSVLPGISVPEITIAVVQVSPQTMGHYQCLYYPEVFLSDYSLRGPPAVA